MGHQQDALNLFLCEDADEAKKIANRLNMFNQERQAKEKEIFEQALQKIEKEEFFEISKKLKNAVLE